MSGPTCRPFLLFIDNTSSSAAIQFRTVLENGIHKSRVAFSTTAVIILHAERLVDLKSIQGQYEVFPLRSKLEGPNEKEQFTAVFEKLKKVHSISPNDMLSFVIMVEDFNEDSKHVRKVVKHNLKDVNQYPIQEKLLTILAVFKFYSNGNLPVSLCERFLGLSPVKQPHKTPPLPIEDRLCPQMKPLVEISYESEVGYGNYKVIQVTHMQVAKQILNIQNEKNSTTACSIVSDYLLNSKAFKPQFTTRKVPDDFTKLMCGRDTEILESGERRGETRKLMFSKLILHVRDSLSQEAAFDLLDKAHETLEEDPVIAQTVARFLAYHKKYDLAKTWGEKAIAADTKKFAYKDTMGHIYKYELVELNEKRKTNTPEDLEHAIKVAERASYFFPKSC